MTNQLQSVSLCLLSVAALVLSAGCNHGRPVRVPVSGMVRIDGKPLSHGVIQFAPAGARPSMGRLNAEGRFTLTCYETGDGVTLGTHKVVVDASQLIGEDSRKWHAPKHYASTNSSGIEVEIDGPRDDVAIELTWSGKGPFVERNL
jgi:hypothetical protein